VVVEQQKAQQAGIDPSRRNLIKHILPEISTPNRIETHKKNEKGRTVIGKQSGSSLFAKQI
jgi:hypothetical protein